MMKSPLTLLLIGSLWLSQYSALTGQNPGCDGTRYKASVFASTIKTTVPYAPTTSYIGDSVTLQMDVYEPAGDPLAKRPVIIVAHGGSFMFGDKTDLASYCIQLAKQGYIAASIEYRLYPLFVLGFPDSVAIFNTAFKAVGDMKAAVRYFRDDASTTNTFRADTAHIFVGGYSAGAVTALHAAYLDAGDAMPSYMAALLPSNGGIEGNSGSTSNRSHSSRFSAVVNLSGGLYRKDWIDKGEVPMSSIHGTADATVPYLKGLAANIAYLEGSGLLHPQAQTVGVESLLTTVVGGGHTNIYEQAQYTAQLSAFWLQTVTLLERLTCETVSTFDLASVSPESWACYPNPLIGNELRLELPASVEQADMRVYSANGELVILSKGVQSGATISFVGLPSGIYLVQVLDPKQPQKLFSIKPVIKN